MTTERSRAPQTFPVGLTIAMLIGLAILLALGTWQVQRLHWKTDLLARIAALQAAPARPVEPVLAALPAGSEADFIRVRASCPGLATAPFLEQYSLYEGQAGSRLISACRINGPRYRTILVDRGFVGDTISARPPVAASETPVEVVGVLRRPDRANLFSPPNRPPRWYVRDVAAMAAALLGVYAAVLLKRRKS